MCPPKAPVVQNPAAAPAPAAQGADSLKLGGTDTTDPEQLARQGLLGRSLLRIGPGGLRSAPGSAASGGAAGVVPPGALAIGPTAGFGGGGGAGGPSSTAGLRIGNANEDTGGGSGNLGRGVNP